MDSEEVGPRVARIEALPDRDGPDDLLVVPEVPRRACHAVEAQEHEVEHPAEGDRRSHQGHGGEDPPGHRACFGPLLPCRGDRADGHLVLRLIDGLGASGKSISPPGAHAPTSPTGGEVKEKLPLTIRGWLRVRGMPPLWRRDFR